MRLTWCNGDEKAVLTHPKRLPPVAVVELLCDEDEPAAVEF